MRRTRDDARSGPAYEQYLIDRQKELDADPVVAFQKNADQQAQELRELLRTGGYIPDAYLPGVERLNGRPIRNVEAAVENFKYFAFNTSTFEKYMASTLLTCAEASDLAPIASNYTALHNLMIQFGAYPDAPVVQPEGRYTDEEVAEILRDQLAPSDRAIVDHQNRFDKIVGHDEMGVAYTEAMLDKLPAKDELRLRRLFESGHRGSNLLTLRREILDIKAQQDAERQAREEGQ